jgi:hypothetical protein
LTQNVERISYASISTVLDVVDPGVFSMTPLVSDGDKAMSVLVTWPPNSETRECPHEGFLEIALVVGGAIIDEKGEVLPEGTIWLLPNGHVHYPRSGPEGARVLLCRVMQS